MKKRYKILIFIIFLSNIISILNFTGFCFREFKYLNDDEILKNFLDSAALNRINYDDNGGLPPEFYFIEENPTNYEILKTLKHIVNNDIDRNVTVMTSLYTGELGLLVTTESLNILETLKKYYTIKDVTHKVDLGGTIKNGRYVYRYADLPINQAFIILNNHNLIEIYGKDAFYINKKRYVSGFYFNLFNSYSNSKEYYVINGKREDSFAHNDLSKFIDSINKRYENTSKYGKTNVFFNIKLNNCGATKEIL